MIQKVMHIEHESNADDIVELGWYDKQKPHLTAVSSQGVEFIVKANAAHLHTHDVLVCENGHKIRVETKKDLMVKIDFDDGLHFAQVAYEIGNRHQPICLHDRSIIVLNDLSLEPLIASLQGHQGIHIEMIEDFFVPTGKAHHAH